MENDPSNETKSFDIDNNDDLEETVDEILKYYDCLDLKQVMLNSIIEITHNNDLTDNEKGLQWYKYWILRYGERMPISLDQASKLCNLASNTAVMTECTTACINNITALSSSNERHMGEDIRVLLPIPSGHFHEDVCESMALIPIATNTIDLSWFPPQKLCENDEYYSEGIDGDFRDNADEDDEDGDNLINMLV
ncbi:hypothetical protein INT45_002103 [Circinella minor]|uniref:Uncharacterized protein n=1 Tax=Circinella minor TaxID=1195481 RepID=A0A8H7SFY8_9FUNG|nr:hypothetical protein INT45_002103 [Circinella minor]